MIKHGKVRERKLLSDLKGLRPLNFIALTAAGIINAVGVTMFLTPAGLFDGGLSGTSMLLYQVTPAFLTLSFFLIVLNVPFYLLGLKKQGAMFTVYSVYAVAVYSVAAYLFQHVLPIDLSVSPIAGDDRLLCALFGGLLSGVGSGMTIRMGGALDGAEVMGVMFARKLGLTVGSFVMCYNVALYVICAVVFNSWVVPLYSIIAYTVGLKAVDFIVEGLDKGKAALIISEKSEEIAAALNAALGRGLTLIPAKGYFSKEDRTAIYCVVNRFQIGRVKRAVTECDENAFVTVIEVSDMLGTSLKLENPLSLKRRKKRQSDLLIESRVVQDAGSQPLGFTDASYDKQAPEPPTAAVLPKSPSDSEEGESQGDSGKA